MKDSQTFRASYEESLCREMDKLTKELVSNAALLENAPIGKAAKDGWIARLRLAQMILGAKQ